MYGITLTSRKDEYVMCNGFTSYTVYFGKITLDVKMQNAELICLRNNRC